MLTVFCKETEEVFQARDFYLVGMSPDEEIGEGEF